MEDVSDKITLAQISQSVARIEAKLDPENQHYILAEINKQIEPLVEVYDGALFVRKFVIGLAAVIIAIGAVGGGIIWAINYIRHG